MSFACIWGKSVRRGHLEGKGPVAGACGCVKDQQGACVAWGRGKTGERLAWPPLTPDDLGTVTEGGSEGLGNLPGVHG